MVLQIRLTDEEIMFWYNHIKSQMSSRKTEDKYCQDNSISLKNFRFKSETLFLKKKYTDSDRRDLLIRAGRYCIDAGCTARQAGDKFGIPESTVAKASLYVRYQKRLKIIHEENNLPFEEDPNIAMEFVPIEEKKITKKEEPDINCIEFSNHGVKILIPHGFDIEKTIKILEFLKDL